MEQRRGRAPLFFDPVPEADEDVVEGLHGPGEDIGGVVFAALFVGAEQLLEERRINLRAAIVLGPDVIEVSAVRQRVLSDNINVAAIELPVQRRQAIAGDEAIAENHVRRCETARVGAAIQNRVLGHFGIERLAVGTVERRREHVVAKPITEPMFVLLIVRPVSENGMERYQSEQAQCEGQRGALAIKVQAQQKGHG